MNSEQVSGLQRAFFGQVTQSHVDQWLATVLHDRLGTGLREVVFRSGRIDAVYGLRTTQERTVVVKIHRQPVDVRALQARIVALRLLAASGYPCPEPIDGPVTRDGHVVTVEQLLERGDSADARRPEIRRALAGSLVEHVAILRQAGHLAPLLGPGPAWTRYSGGPWPVPHDPIFDFTSTPTGWEWLDLFARQAADDLRRSGGHADRVIGHGDWYAGNVRFDGTEVVAVFDWDLIVRSEAVLAGTAAGGYLADGAPTARQVAEFLADVDDARHGTFTGGERRAASAAARWVLAFNARCDLSNAGNRADLDDEHIAPGSALARLRQSRNAYQELAW